ncbi:MAG: MMPL family transporter, partial [Proteobacteria bacterium]|nr:MMPL family transporter [Pseudomonadota bacterium]
SFFSPPSNIAKIVDTDRGVIHWILNIIAKIGFGKGAVTTLILTIIITIFATIAASKVEIGDVHPGSPILWEDSNYNIAIDSINKSFPGTDELYILVEGDGPRAVESPGFLRVLNSFQRHMEKSSFASRTQSVSDLVPSVYKTIYGGHPKWETIPLEKAQAAQIFYRLGSSSAPGDYDLYYSRDESVANVVIWYKDHMGNTLREAIAAVQEFIENNKEMLAKEKCSLQLASGTLGMQAATNEAVSDSQLLNLILVLGSVFLLCAITYRSVVAAVFLMIPLNLANIITLSVMHELNIGLNINTLPIVSVGVGVGIDYGIYLLSRFCEEFQINGGYSFAVANRAISTTGKAIFFTATTMVIGVLFWYFFSSMKFQAEMGLLLAIIMLLNMIGALVILPMLLYIFKPKFLGKSKVVA